MVEAKKILMEYWSSLTQEQQDIVTGEYEIKWLTLTRNGKILGHNNTFPKFNSSTKDWETYNVDTLTNLFRSNVNGYDDTFISLDDKYNSATLVKSLYNASTGTLTHEDIIAYNNNGYWTSFDDDVCINDVCDYIDYETEDGEGQLCYIVTCADKESCKQLILDKLKEELYDYESEVKDFKSYISKLEKDN